MSPSKRFVRFTEVKTLEVKSFFSLFFVKHDTADDLVELYDGYGRGPCHVTGKCASDVCVWLWLVFFPLFCFLFVLFSFTENEPPSERVPVATAANCFVRGNRRGNKTDKLFVFWFRFVSFCFLFLSFLPMTPYTVLETSVWLPFSHRLALRRRLLSKAFPTSVCLE